MSTERLAIRVAGLELQIVRKDIKNLHLGVYPPNGRVRVAAPLGVSNDAVRLAVVGKLGWIKKQQARFASQAREAEREMVSGESHYFLGRRYRLRVVERAGRAGVALKNRTTLELRVPGSYPTKRREQVLERWYRQRLRELIPPLAAKWEPALGVRVAAFGIRRMKTKWGACSIDRRHVWLNLELVKKPLRCLEYVAVHELTHLLERHHTDRFIRIMDQHMPRWRAYRDELNSTPLAHESWTY